jgi:hypothetical protein
MENKDLIIQYLKDVIVEQKSKLVDYNHLSNKQIERTEKLINDLNICQSANKRQSEIIKELQLENSEVNKLLKFRTKVIDYVSIPYFIVSVIYIVSNLIK